MQSSCAAALCQHFFRAPLQITMTRPKKRYGGGADDDVKMIPNGNLSEEEQTIAPSPNEGNNEVVQQDKPKPAAPINEKDAQLHELVHALIDETSTLYTNAINHIEVEIAVRLISGLNDACYDLYNVSKLDEKGNKITDEDNTIQQLYAMGCKDGSNKVFSAFLQEKTAEFTKKTKLSVPIFHNKNERPSDMMDDYLQLIFLYKTCLLNSSEFAADQVGEVIHAAWAAYRFSDISSKPEKQLPSTFDKSDAFNNVIETATEKRVNQRMLWLNLNPLGKLQDILPYMCIRWVIEYLKSVGCDVLGALSKVDSINPNILSKLLTRKVSANTMTLEESQYNRNAQLNPYPFPEEGVSNPVVFKPRENVHDLNQSGGWKKKPRSSKTKANRH